MEITKIYEWLENNNSPELRTQWEGLANAVWFYINTTPWSFDSEKFGIMMALSKQYMIDVPNKRTLLLFDMNKLLFGKDPDVNEIDNLINRFI